MGYQQHPDGTRITDAGRNLAIGQSTFLRTDDGTEQMNVNGVAAGTPTVLWNGTGGSDSGGDWTPGNQGSETAGSAHSGTNGWDSSTTTAGQNSEFDNGSDLDIAGTYDTLSFWMQPKAYSSGSNLQVLWKASGGTTKGNVLNVADYVTNFDLDVWQRVEIPISDFALPDDVAKIQFKYANKGGQQFWFDDIELNTGGGGGPFIFRAEAPTGQNFHVSMLVLMVSGPSAGWTSTNFANIASLGSGLLLRQRRISTGETLWKFNSKDNMDLFGRFHPQDDIEFSDGTLLVGFMVKPGKASIVVTDDDVLEVVVRDDLSALAGARAYAHYGVEVIS